MYVGVLTAVGCPVSVGAKFVKVKESSIVVAGSMLGVKALNIVPPTVDKRD